MADYAKAMKSLSTLIRPGGHLLIIEPLNQSMYVVGGQKFSYLSLDEKVVKQGLEKANFEIMQCKDISSIAYSTEILDAKGIHFSIARK